MAERLKSTRKNIMREFSISELSAVDRPAQVHARMSLMKRADYDDEQQEQPKMQKILTRSDNPPLAFNSLEAAMAHLQKINGLSKSDAMSKAAREHPDLLAKYRDEGDKQISKALERMQSPTEAPAVAEFKRLVDAIVARDMCPRTTALRRARAEDPDLFRRYQEN